MATKKTSTKFDTAHNIETEADLTNKTATVKNLVTGEQYLGGGGGGGGEDDLVLHKVTITLNSSAGEANYEIAFQQILEGADDTPYMGLRNVEGSGLVTSAFSEYATAGNDPVSVEIYLMENAYATVKEMSGSASVTGEYTISGDGEVVDLDGDHYVKVTGDCEITAAGYTEAL